MMACRSRVERTSNSKPWAPCSSARSKADRVFYGAQFFSESCRAPRCPSNRSLAGKQVSELIEIKVADHRAFVRRFLGLLHGFLELFLQHAGLVLFRVHGLAEERLFAAFLLAH